MSEGIITRKHSYDKYFEESGIITNKVHTQNLTDSINIIDSNLKKGYPTIIDIKSNNCPWLKSINEKFVFQHFCIIVGRTEQGFKCLDPSNGQSVYILCYEEYLKGNTFIIEFQKNGNTKKIFNLKKNIINIIYDNNEFIYDNINKFTAYIENKDVVAFEDYNEISMKLKYISNGRYKLSKILKKYFPLVYEEQEMFRLAIDMLKKCGENWLIIKNLILKQSIAGENLQSEIIRILENTGKKEQDIAKIIIKTRDIY
ncbi:hypothetical protein [Staphylococcus gallinarum]|uniref:hypothetical protein n=1 Tax=Staphylococcus gallinarum TaxID=1293 RepID=UPI002DBC931B|nr:hypothetical protein [Staphylococcus gallinarum]MEB7040092.1 hypothetical protein [Staphylococcus gallinarum]